MNGLVYQKPIIDAIFSDDRQYRYWWAYTWDKQKPPLCVVMCNPSVANEKYPDRTTTRVVKFAQTAKGFGAVEVVNLFALVSTDPNRLLTHPSPVGPANYRYIEETARKCGSVWCAWGSHIATHNRAAIVKPILFSMKSKGVRLYHVGLTQQGHPRHPLYIPAVTPLTEWE